MTTVVEQMLTRYPRDTDAQTTHALREVMQEIALAGLNRGGFKDHIATLDVESARSDVLPFVREPAGLAIWSKDYFAQLAERIRFA